MSHLAGKVYITADTNWPASHNLYTAGAYVFIIYNCHLLFRGFLMGVLRDYLWGAVCL